MLLDDDDDRLDNSIGEGNLEHIGVGSKSSIESGQLETPPSLSTQPSQSKNMMVINYAEHHERMSKYEKRPPASEMKTGLVPRLDLSKLTAQIDTSLMTDSHISQVNDKTPVNLNNLPILLAQQQYNRAEARGRPSLFFNDQMAEPQLEEADAMEFQDMQSESLAARINNKNLLVQGEEDSQISERQEAYVKTMRNEQLEQLLQKANSISGIRKMNMQFKEERRSVRALAPGTHRIEQDYWDICQQFL